MGTSTKLAVCVVAMLATASAAVAQPPAAARPKVRIMNGTGQEVEVFWLEPGGGRAAHGTIPPGADTVISTTIGHQG